MPEDYPCDCGQTFGSQSAMLACLLEHDTEDHDTRRAARHHTRRLRTRPLALEGYGYGD